MDYLGGVIQVCLILCYSLLGLAYTFFDGNYSMLILRKLSSISYDPPRMLSEV